MGRTTLKSERLEQLFSLCPEGARVADVGTDHALLPIALISRQRASFAIAADLRQGPLAYARRHIANANLTDHIDVRSGDGLAPLRPDDNLDAIFVAGMGPRTILEILSNTTPPRSLGSPLLILQSPQDITLLREFAWTALEATVRDEILLLEDDQLYHTLVIDLTRAPNQAWETLPEVDRVVGRPLLDAPSDALDAYMQRKLTRANARHGGLSRADHIDPATLDEAARARDLILSLIDDITHR